MSAKIFIIPLFFILSAGLSLYAEETAGAVKPFVFTDIFSFESPVKKGDSEKTWSFSLSGGYTEKSGNTDTVNTTFGGFVKFDDDITEFRIGYSGSYGRLKGVVNDNKGTGIINFDNYLFWRFEFFSYSMIDYNRITHLRYRSGSGAGGKFFIIRNSYLRVDISGAPIYQYEDFEDQPADKQWRWSIRGRVQIFPVEEKFSIKYYFFYIPVIENRDEYRTIQEITAEVKIGTSLMLKTGYYREYNTYNAEAYQKNPLLKKTDSTVYAQAGVNL